MKSIKKQLSLFLVLALILGTFGNLTFASAATKSSWYFKTSSGQTIEVGEYINMQKQEFQDFNIYKSGKEIKTNDATRKITWSSDNPDVVWIDSKNGKARADKYNKMTEEYGEAVITAKIHNKTTGAVTYRRFKVSVGTTTASVDHISLVFKDGTDSSQTLKMDRNYELETLVYDTELEVITAEDASLYFAYFCDKTGIIITGSTITPVQAGEYTITVGAFETEEAAKAASSVKDAVFTDTLNLVVEDNGPQITSIRQVTLDSVAITFNKPEYAKALTADSRLLTVAYDFYGYPQLVDFHELLIDDEDPSTVLVSLYSGLTEGLTYTFTYKGTETISAAITGSGTKPAQIMLQSEQVQIERDYYFEVKILNDKGVDITNLSSYTCTFESLDPETAQQYIMDGNSLYFFTAGQVAVIKASLDLGYDEYGNQIPPLTHTARFVSIPQIKPIIGSCNGFALAAPGVKASSLTYDTALKTICAGEFDMYSVYATFPYIDEERETHTHYIANGIDTADTIEYARYTYKSSNPNVLEVNETTGMLFPFAKGAASIYIFDNADENKKLVGTMNISVADERALTSLALTNQSSGKLSATGNTDGDEYVTVKLTAKDQLGTTIKSSDITYTYTIKEPADSNFDALFSHEFDPNTGILKIWEGALLDDVVTTKSPVRRFSIYVTATYKDQERSQKFDITVKNVTNVAEADTVQKLVISNTSIDLKLNKDSLDDYKSVLQVVTTDKSGYFIRRESVQLVSSANTALKGAGDYSLVILYKNTSVTENIIGIENTDGTVTLNPLTVLGNEIVKTKNLGTYSVRLYKGNGTKAEPKSNATIVLSDSTPPITVSVKTKNITDTDPETIKNAITVKRGDTDISAYVDRVIPMNERMVNTTYQIPEMILYIQVKEFNPNWSSDSENGYYTEVTLTGLNLQFKKPY